MQKLKVTTSAHLWSTVQILKQFSMYITSNSYNMLPIQLSVLDKGWAGLDRPEISDGIKAIRSASSNEEAKAAWEDLQSFIYEYGAASDYRTFHKHYSYEQQS